jgi:predicted lactoylglutathione lyase
MSIVSHVSVGASKEKMGEMLTLYDAFMTKLGATRKMAIEKDGKHCEDLHQTSDLVAVAYGKYYPEVWVSLPHDEKDASPGNGAHFAFACRNQAQVDEVYQAAIANGAVCNGKPGPRPQYSDKYYGAFFIDPCGNKLEATFYDLGLFNYCTIL